jgi:diketogulonate reductase-like aldo/keto reductase
MLSRKLGASNVQIPEIGLGTWHYGAGPEPLRKGLDSGALFIDTAESYGTEPAVADAIAGRRERIFLATKVSPNHFRRADVIRAADSSLQRLRTDHVDLYQLHEPNEQIPIEETLGTMEELVDAGKVRFIGVSNFSVAQMQRAQRAMRKYLIVSNQVRFNLIDRTICENLLPYCQSKNITVIAYSPLARGFHHITDSDPKNVLEKLSKATGRTPVQIALNWCLCHERVIVIPKGNSVEHMIENCGASDWRLTNDQVRELGEAIVFRRRGRLDAIIRRSLSPEMKKTIQAVARLMPAPLRRRLT